MTWAEIAELTIEQLWLEMTQFGELSKEDAARQQAANSMFASIAKNYQMEESDWWKLGDDELICRIVEKFPVAAPTVTVAMARKQLDGYLNREQSWQTMKS